MSLSPIRSIINDFLVLVRAVGSEAGGSRFIEICNDFGAVCFFFSKTDGFSFFNEEWDVDNEVFCEAGLYTLGVENPCGAFEIGAAGFFVAFIMFLISLLGGVFLLVTILLVSGFFVT